MLLLYTLIHVILFFPGRYVLDELGLEIDVYLASEIDEEAITVTTVRHGEKVQHIGDVRNITSAEVGYGAICLCL